MHPESWINTDSDEFHGKKVLAVSYGSCKSCHGDNLKGGESTIACVTCHEIYPHYSDWNEIAATDFHGNYIRTQKQWSMADCRNCHGTDYKGGRSGASCQDCHKGTHCPEECNVCHGNSMNAAPPEDLTNRTSTSNITVGAHQVMISQLVESNPSLTVNNVCTVCHQLPGNVSASGHIDNTPHAEVLQTLGWDRNTGTCSNSCHGIAGHIWNDFK